MKIKRYLLLLLSMINVSIAVAETSNQQVSSAAFNYSQGDVEVDPRTGQLDLSHHLGKLYAKSLGEDFHLTASYNSSGLPHDHPYRISDHWGFGLGIVADDVFYSGSGQRYYPVGVSNGKLIFQYNQMKSLSMTTDTFDENTGDFYNVEVLTKSGKKETYCTIKTGQKSSKDPCKNPDKSAKFLVLKEVTYPKGYKLTFHYTNDGSDYRLHKVSDSNGNNIHIHNQIGESSRLRIESAIRKNKTDKKVDLEMTDIDNSSRKLGSINQKITEQDGTIDNYRTKFEYYDSEGVATDSKGLLKSVTSPLGAYKAYSYGGIKINKSNSETALLPVVTKACSWESSADFTKYERMDYAYGGDGSNSQDGGCENGRVTNQGPQFERHNYLGYPTFAYNSDELFSKGYKSGSQATKKHPYTYHVRSTKTNSDNSSKVLKDQHYDHLQRPLNNITTVYKPDDNGDEMVLSHTVEVAYSYDSQFEPDFDVKKNNQGNQNNTQITHQYASDQPSSPIYNMPKIVKTKHKVASSGETAVSSAISLYDTYGNVLHHETSPQGHSKDTLYDQDHTYNGVPFLPKIVVNKTKVNDKSAQTTHVHQIQEYSLENGGYYFAVAQTNHYYQPDQNSNIKGINITQPASQAPGYPLTEIKNHWGSKTSSYGNQPYLYRQETHYAENSPLIQQDSIQTNTGTPLTTDDFMPRTENIILYKYEDNPQGGPADTHLVKEIKLSYLDQAATQQHKIYAEHYYDDASGLVVKSSGPIQADGNGKITHEMTYDALGRVIKKEGIVTSAGNDSKTVKKHHIHYKLREDDDGGKNGISKKNHNELTGYIKQINLNTAGKLAEEFDNAFLEQGDQSHCDIGMCQVSKTTYNATGKKKQVTHYNEAASTATPQFSSSTTKYEYDELNRITQIVNGNGTASHILHVDLWANPDRQENSLQGNKVKLTAHYSLPDTDNTSTVDQAKLPIKVTELSNKTGKHLATYLLPYPDDMNNSDLVQNMLRTCSYDDINEDFITCVLKNKLYYSKVEKEYNLLGNLVMVQAPSPDASQYDASQNITHQFVYDILGRNITKIGPESESGAGDQITVHTRRDINGKAICIAKSQYGADNLCEGENTQNDSLNLRN